ncbi:DUF7536 family protein [Halorientalis pallida]|uniref:DUF7536 family protein n=1 Tax=Halorientalis pallida TaxID=2479928 RepID=UPI003C6EA91E
MTDDGDATASPDNPPATGAGSDGRPDRPGGAAAMMEALNVRDNALRGFIFGFVFTTAVFTFFVVVPGVSRSPLYYVALAFVLATGLGALVTAALVLRDAYRLSKTL